jgi:hypothetical protein
MDGIPFLRPVISAGEGIRPASDNQQKWIKQSACPAHQ